MIWNILYFQEVLWLTGTIVTRYNIERWTTETGLVVIPFRLLRVKDHLNMDIFQEFILFNIPNYASKAFSSLVIDQLVKYHRQILSNER